MSKVERELDRAMTVSDLIDELRQYDEDTPVLFTCNYGDYSRTQQAIPCVSVDPSDSSNLSESAYSQSGIALDDDGSDQAYFCPKCEEEMDVTVCPKCKSTCLNEDGSLANSDDDDGREILIINLG